MYVLILPPKQALLLVCLPFLSFIIVQKLNVDVVSSVDNAFFGWCLLWTQLISCFVWLLFLLTFSNSCVPKNVRLLWIFGTFSIFESTFFPFSLFYHFIVFIYFYFCFFFYFLYMLLFFACIMSNANNKIYIYVLL